MAKWCNHLWRNMYVISIHFIFRSNRYLQKQSRFSWDFQHGNTAKSRSGKSYAFRCVSFDCCLRIVKDFRSEFSEISQWRHGKQHEKLKEIHLKIGNLFEVWRWITTYTNFVFLFFFHEIIFVFNVYVFCYEISLMSFKNVLNLCTKSL